MSITRSLSEVVRKACDLKTKEEQVAWLRENDSQALRMIFVVVYDPQKYVWNIPNTTIPPYKPSPHTESHGMLYRQIRKLRYLIKGFDGDKLTQYRREYLFIELLESIDKDYAALMEQVLLQQKFVGLPASVIVEAFGDIIPLKRKTKDDQKKQEV